MKVLDFLEPAVVFSPDDTVNRVISRMCRERRSEVVIAENNQFVGMVFARDLAKRKIDNPEKTKINSFITHTGLLDADADIGDIVKTILLNDCRSVPFTKNASFFILTKLKVLELLKNDPLLKNRRASEIMTFPYSVSPEDPIDTAISILRDTGVSRLMVLGENNSPEGILDSLDILSANIKRTRVSMGEKAGDSYKIRGIQVSSLMERDVPRTGEDGTIKEIIEKMVKSKNNTIVVEQDGKTVGIITPRSILKLFGREFGEVYVTISGIKDEDSFLKSVIDEEIMGLLKKLGKILKIEELILHIHKHHETGHRVKYSVKSRMMTEKGMFFSHDHAWDITKAVRGVLNKLEREVIIKKEKPSLRR